MRRATFICLLALLLQGCAGFGGNASGDRLARIQASPNHNGETFVNNVETPRGFTTSPFSVIGEAWCGNQVRRPEQPLPLAEIGAVGESPAAMQVTWLGHSTSLIEVDGFRVLTDPVWSEQITPVAGIGPTRYLPPPISLGDLPELDAVIISHDHYDHLDYDTIQALAESDVPFVVPLGVGAHFAAWDVPEERIIELDWWDEWSPVEGLRLVATPARHFSGRSLLDRNSTLWASWAVIGPKHRVYFGGDTGMFPGFKDIGDKLGPFDATLMPIGAYGDAWPDIHLNPEEAVKAHQMVRGDIFIPIHWGTFNLALHDWFEPPERLLAAVADQGINVAFPLAGEKITHRNTPLVHTWWRTPAVELALESPREEFVHCYDLVGNPQF